MLFTIVTMVTGYDYISTWIASMRCGKEGSQGCHGSCCHVYILITVSMVPYKDIVLW